MILNLQSCRISAVTTRQDGSTPIFVAAAEGHVDVMKWLMQQGSPIDIPCESGETPLFVASQYGQLKAVTWLIENGANPDVATKYSLTPVVAAAQRKHFEVVRFLLHNLEEKNSKVLPTHLKHNLT